MVVYNVTLWYQIKRRGVTE